MAFSVIFLDAFVHYINMWGSIIITIGIFKVDILANLASSMYKNEDKID